MKFPEVQLEVHPELLHPELFSRKRPLFVQRGSYQVSELPWPSGGLGIPERHLGDLLGSLGDLMGYPGMPWGGRKKMEEVVAAFLFP